MHSKSHSRQINVKKLFGELRHVKWGHVCHSCTDIRMVFCSLVDTKNSQQLSLLTLSSPYFQGPRPTAWRLSDSQEIICSEGVSSVVQQPNLGPGRLIFEVSRSRTFRQTDRQTGRQTDRQTHTHTRARAQNVGLLWTSDQLVTEVAAYTTAQKTNIHALSGISTLVPGIELPQTYALDCMTTGIGFPRIFFPSGAAAQIRMWPPH
jgi:hypothetical protein